MVLARDDNGEFIQAVALGACQNVAVGAASMQSATAFAGASVVRPVATVDTCVAVGVNPPCPNGASMLRYIGSNAGTDCRPDRDG